MVRSGYTGGGHAFGAVMPATRSLLAHRVCFGKEKLLLVGDFPDEIRAGYMAVRLLRDNT
jgi:hypothetical protein